MRPWKHGVRASAAARSSQRAHSRDLPIVNVRAVAFRYNRFTSTGDIRSVAMNVLKDRKAIRRPRDASAVESAEALESAASENRVESA
jgi:hypothetical protein